MKKKIPWCTLHSQWFEPSGPSLTCPSQPSWERVNYRRCQKDEASKVCSEAHTEFLLRKKRKKRCIHCRGLLGLFDKLYIIIRPTRVDKRVSQSLKPFRPKPLFILNSALNGGLILPVRKKPRPILVFRPLRRWFETRGPSLNRNGGIFDTHEFTVTVELQQDSTKLALTCFSIGWLDYLEDNHRHEDSRQVRSG